MHTNDSKSTGAGTILLGIAAVALAGMVGTITLIHQVGELGPRVGDIIAFDPLDSMSRDMHARVTATLVHSNGGDCVLDVRAMHTNGGSVIIEQRDPSASLGYRIHWAGPRSANDGANCGSSAELLVSVDDLEVLAMAAGGYGVPASKHANPLMRMGDTVQ